MILLRGSVLMKIVMFRHFSFDDPTMFVTWSNNAGHELIVHDPAQGIDQEWLHALDLLVILGGPMSVYQEEEYKWLSAEKEFVKQAIEMKKKVLGVCLGAQMIAEVLGASVMPNREKEIGWHRLYRNGEHHPWLTHIPEQFISFSWHGDTFTLPEGARPLIYSAACENQAFAYGEHVMGLQFHLETTPDCIHEMLHNWSHELIEVPYIQNESEIRAGLAYSEQSKKLLWGILDQISRREPIPSAAS